MTSRQKKAGEQEGREYNFLRKEDILQKIRDKNMIEWGELENNLYGKIFEKNLQFTFSWKIIICSFSFKE